MNRLYLDLETYSAVPIDDGVWRYVEGSEILLLSIAFNDGPVKVFEWGELGIIVPLNLNAEIAKASQVITHSDDFDFTVLAHHGCPVPVSKRYSTMAQARSHGLPGGLLKLCELFKLPEDQSKDKEGRNYIHLFCKPQKDGSRCTKHTHPKQWAGFRSYAGRDVIAMRELHKLMPVWNDAVERPVWELDQVINARGFYVDVVLARSVVGLLESDTKSLDQQTKDATDGAVGSTRQRDRVLAYLLDEHGVDLPDLTRSTLERRLNDPDLPDGVRELIAIRLQSAKTSVSKHSTLLRGVNEDHRLRGALVYCGAGRTGRWAAKRFQAHNPPRPTLSGREFDIGRRGLRCRAIGLVSERPVTEYASNAVRSLVTAAPNHRLVMADYSNVEGRVVAWLAGERWKLDAFRSYDRAAGVDLYRLAYSRAFKVDPAAVTSEQRQIGKVMELMLGFGGGVAAFITGANTYHIDLDAIVVAWPSIPRAIQIEAEKMWAWAEDRDQTYDLKREVYCTCDALKRLWRKENPAIVELWNTLEQGYRHVTTGALKSALWGDLVIDKQGAWLRIKLPSGRFLCYPQPKIKSGDCTYMGFNTYSRTWVRRTTWGGTLTENVTQAVARDLLASGLINAEREGWNPVLHVHDEIIGEVSGLIPSLVKPEMFAANVTILPKWAEGLPLAAKGRAAQYWSKDD